MKKLILIVIAVCVGIGAIIGIILGTNNNKGHEHDFKTEWTTNETHHWHTCKDSDCLEISDKSAHSWNNGEITLDPTADADGEKTFTCTTCNATKKENVPFTGITQVQWEDLTNPELFNNVTIITEQVDMYFRSVSEVRIVDDYFYLQGANYDLGTGALVGSQPWIKRNLADIMNSSMSNTVLPDLKNYEKIEYDSEKDLYCYTETFEITDVSVPDNPLTFTYTKWECTLKDGKVWKINSECWYIDDTDGRVDVAFSTEYKDYNTTVAPIN